MIADLQQMCGRTVCWGAVFVVACGSPVEVEAPDPFWTEGPALPIPLQSFGAALHDGLIYVAGGQTLGRATISAVFRIDPRGGSWERVADLPRARTGAHLTVAGDSLFSVGGSNISSDGFTTVGRELYVYDPTSDTWDRRENFPDRRSGAQTVGTTDRIVVVGGGLGSVNHGDLGWEVRGRDDPIEATCDAEELHATVPRIADDEKPPTTILRDA